MYVPYYTVTVKGTKLSKPTDSFTTSEGDSITFEFDLYGASPIIGVRNTNLPYQLVGIDQSDLQSGNVRGTVAINAQGRGELTLGIAADQKLEGTESFYVDVPYRFRVGNATLASPKISINDISVPSLQETFPPSISTITPGDKSVDVDPNSNVNVVFSQDINRSAGLIELRKDSATGPLVESFDVATSVRLVFTKNNLSIDPSSSLSFSSNYCLVVPAGAVVNASGKKLEATSVCGFSTWGAFKATSNSEAITGTDGNDSINGFGGNDTIHGQGGSDTLTGGTGNDRFVVSSGKATITDLSDSDSLDVRPGASVEATMTAPWRPTSDICNLGKVAISTPGFEVNLGSSTSLTGKGFEVTNIGSATKLGGSFAADTLTGGIGNDTISGGPGKDVICGREGNDSIKLQSLTPDLGDKVVFAGGSGVAGTLGRVAELGLDTINGIKLGTQTTAIDVLQFSAASFGIVAGTPVVKGGGNVDGNFYIFKTGPALKGVDLNGTASGTGSAIVFVGDSSGTAGVKVYFTTQEGSFRTETAVQIATLVAINTSNIDASDLAFVA